MNKVKLGDVAKYSDTRVKLSNLTVENYIGTDNMLQNKQGKVNSDYLLKEGQTTQYKKNDILIANIRPYLKKIWFATNEGGSSADVLTIRLKENNFLPKFVYYNLFQDSFFDYAMKVSKGSKMPRGDKKQILNFPISNFELPTQSAIAGVLSSFDDKIALNNKINKELEDLAKTIYDYWLVQNADEKWERKRLKEFFTFSKGTEVGAKAYFETKKNKNFVKFYRVGDIDGVCNTFVDMTDSNLVFVEPYDVIVTFDGSVGKIGIGLDGAISSGLQKIYDPIGKIDNSVIWLIFLDKRIQKTIQQYATGSVLLHASRSIDYLTILYNEKIYFKFQKIVSPIFEQIIKNRQESTHLAHLRDWLLPMLMNGQVSVKDPSIS